MDSVYYQSNKPVTVESIPEELKRLAQWVSWKKESVGTKVKKIPLDPEKGVFARVSDASTWSSFEKALHFYRSGGCDGIGFVFKEDDPYLGLDLDHCMDPQTGQIQPWAKEIIDKMESYTEVSPSGAGVHIFVKGKLPGLKKKFQGVEIYDRGRFFTVTGHCLENTPNTIEERQERLIETYNRLNEAHIHNGHSASAGCMDANKTVQRLSERFGTRFTDLWEGAWSQRYGSQSEADLALCHFLGIGTDGDSLLMDQLFRQSGLFREKWDYQRGPSSYGNKTIQKALSSKFLDEGVQTSEQEKTSQGGEYKLTDLGNGERFADFCKEKARFCKKWKSWLVWDGRRWTRDDKNEISIWAKKVIRKMYAEASREADDVKRTALVKHARASENNSRIKAMIERASAEPPMPVIPEELDVKTWLFNCLNGTIDLKTGSIRPHDPNNMMTQLAPVAYNPDAKCPLWLKFLDQVLDGNRELIEFLKRAIGYSLTGVTREQCLFMLHGNGANGKSTFINTIGTMLGDYAKQTPTETLLVKQKGAIPNDIARLVGARLVMASEAEMGQALAESLIKQMTGEDILSARFLHGEWFDFTPTHKVFLGTNHKPVIRGVDHAIWRRIRLIPFNVTIPDEDQDHRLREKLENELEGILAWAVRGCLEWQKQGLGEPDEVADATGEYRQEMDLFGRFLSDCCEIGPAATVSSRDIYQAYAKWCEENGESCMTQSQVVARLQEKAFTKRRVGETKMTTWFGLRLSDAGSTPNSIP
jgi:putative DNA primase/helicase